MAQFVVHFAEPIPEETRKDPCSITRDLNTFIGLHPDIGKTRVATAKWNFSGNLVISVLTGQSAAPLVPYFRDFQEFYTVNTNVPVDTKLNKVWHKIIVDGVSTGSQWRLASGVTPRPHNPSELREELVMYNPILEGVELALDPRFVIQPSELAHKKESSIQFAVSDSKTAEDILRGRTLNMFGKTCKVQVTLRTDIVSDRDTMVLDVKPRNGRRVTFIHVYNDPSRGRQQALWQLRNLELPLNQPVVVTGDANLHHIRWSRGVPRTPSITEEIVEWMDRNHFILNNKKGVPTHFPHDTEKHPSVIDLTWVNLPAAEVDATREWAIDPDLATGSDHTGIRWKYDPGGRPIDNPFAVKYNLKAVKPKEWIEAFDEEIEKRRERLSPVRRSEEVTTTQLDDAAEAFTEAMQAATEKVAKI
ncbi:Endonuclease/exonuclease/phosphatase, partial [Lentinula raphanica]